MRHLQEDARRAREKPGAALLRDGLCGAHAYGTQTEDSDQDVRGVFFPPWTVLVGTSKLETIECQPDTVLHSLRKAVRLWAQGNPNMLDWLFLPEDCVWWMEPKFAEIIYFGRQAFLSKRLHARFRGYAYSHLQKMERGVTRELGAKRKAAIEEFGYSPKNAMHLIRLAEMGCEVLETGEYNVRRPNADMLLAIRRGEWDMEKVQREGARLLARLDCALESSPLPDEPDKARINRMLVELTLAARRWKR